MFPMFPYLPSYSGPHPVGTTDIEIPLSELSSPAPLPQNFDIPTIKARIFYPCGTTKTKAKSVYWVPDPQWEYLQAFASFLGASSRLSKAVA
jgi:platelet-activating factor acetylhydrolase